jgi:hypothetical protein
LLSLYGYDALGRRITHTRPTGQDPVTTDFYYTSDWQVLEERIDGVVVALNVWSLAYIDALVLRDRDADADPETGDYGLEQRLYVQQDANWNVTALAPAFCRSHVAPAPPPRSSGPGCGGPGCCRRRNGDILICFNAAGALG